MWWFLIPCIILKYILPGGIKHEKRIRQNIISSECARAGIIQVHPIRNMFY